MTTTNLTGKPVHIVFFWILVVLLVDFTIPGSSAIASLKRSKGPGTLYYTEDSPSIKSVRDRHLACLAKNIYYEAGSEPYEGKVAVAQVTLNRANSGHFPNDICKVVYQKHAPKACEFSWYCSVPNAANKTLRSENYKESMEVAKQVLVDGLRLRAVDNALFFHGKHVRPKWKKRQIARIGNHIFY